MAMSLFWRGKVVRNISLILVAMAAISWADAQSLAAKKITYSNSTDFETVINDLSKATGVYFVYSSNKIPASQQVTLSVSNKPLNEILDLLSKQLNLSFKIQEHYITVKPSGTPYRAAITELASLKKTFEPKEIKLPDQEIEKAERTVGKFVTEKISNAIELPSSEGDISPYVVKLKPYFETDFLKKVPVRYLKSATKKLRVDHHWFVSAGSVVNDYSAGVEIQAGLRQAYFVFSPTWLRDDQYHGALGIGTSLQLSNVFSLRPVYSYATIKETKIEHSNVMFARSPGYQAKTTTDHHQFKVMVQYDISKALKFRVGPTFNQSRATTNYQLQEVTSYRTGPPQYNPPNSGGGTHVVFRSNVVPAPASVTSNRFWIGWEASLSYRINFK